MEDSQMMYITAMIFMIASMFKKDCGGLILLGLGIFQLFLSYIYRQDEKKEKIHKIKSKKLRKK